MDMRSNSPGRCLETSPPGLKPCRPLHRERFAYLVTCGVMKRPDAVRGVRTPSVRPVARGWEYTTLSLPASQPPSHFSELSLAPRAPRINIRGYFNGIILLMDDFWHQLPRPFFVLAPMEAVTDTVFRHVIARAARPDVFFTEFTNTDSFCSPRGNHSTRGRLVYKDDEQPMIAHIWGDKPELFANMAKQMKVQGFAGIDINMGCPAPNVAPKGKGSGLINHPDNAAMIIAACKESGLPVSVKTRLGYTNISEWHGWIAHLLTQDITNLTIHLRARKEMSKVPAHYEVIADLKALRDQLAPQTLLTINGDIRDRTHGMELVDQYGVDGIMIGRGVFGNPFAFEHEQREHTKAELLELLNYHLDLYDQYQDITKRPYETLKRFYKIYIRDFNGASELRDRLMHTKNTAEVRGILASLS